jgi:glyoxylase-like metal-dependent hydrolase (beta-lactamase superfamily II)
MTAQDLEVVVFALGPAQTNAYLVGDPTAHAAVVIDPAWDGKVIAREAEERGWRIQAVWLTHAHFDHFGGSAELAGSLPVPVPVALHSADQSLWRADGLAGLFGIRGLDPGPEPTVPLEQGARLWLGAHQFEVRHSPGHTPGHVIFVLRESSIAFCGDLIFRDGVGRTDLPGGDRWTLEESLRREILSLPDEFRLLPGHGPETTVGREKRSNPFLEGLPERS